MTIENEWNCNPGNYIIAGSDCFVSLLGNFIDKHGGDKFFDDSKLNNFIRHSIDRYLFSFGTGLNYKTRKMSPKHTDKIGREVQKIIDRPLMKDTQLYIDSGGFQVAMGAVETKNMPSFIDKYHQFIQDNHHNFSYAFSLDLPPGPSNASNIFDSYEQIEELNRISYQKSKSLPSESKDKMIYIHHFRSPSLYDTWSKFLWEENLAEGMNNFATGGIVANMATDLTIPVIIYSIPLSEILKYALANNMKQFNFHVLGGANFIDVFYHKLFSYHIKQVHDVDVRITYDSSAIFKALAIGRFIPVFRSDGVLMKMDIKSKNIHMRFDGKYSVQDVIYQLLNQMADAYNFAPLNPIDHPIYNPETGTLSRCVHMYLICYYLRIYRYLELISDDFIMEAYPSFEAGHIQDFDNKCYQLAQRFNQGKNTKKQKAKIASIYRSLQILTNLDRDYNRHLIHKFMSNDDISIMADGGIPKF